VLASLYFVDVPSII